MAQVPNQSTRRMAARLRHWIYPAHREVALIVMIEVGLTILGLPLWEHVALGVVLHLTVSLGEAAWPR
ncbi:MAG: hypothetical protein ACSLFB_01130 [Acidimicrobiales bacterium]